MIRIKLKAWYTQQTLLSNQIEEVKFYIVSAHLNLVLRSNVVSALQAFQMNHYCDSKSFDDFEKIIANYLEIEKVV